MEKWLLRNPKHDLYKMSEQLGVSEMLCRIIVNRGITDYSLAEGFIRPDLQKLHEPLLMKDLGVAAGILALKIKEGKTIRIVGDYDVDGVISTFVLYKALTRCGASVDFDIPHRIHDGYGINLSIIDKASNDGIDTIITCDNGISAAEQVEYAKKLGMTVIVTDHHDVPFIEQADGKMDYILPAADAVIDIKQQDCKYPFKSLCGAGVAFKLVQALYPVLGIPADEAMELLEYVAIATVCDVVDLLGENRIIVKNGLEMINNTTNKGLKALLSQTGIEGKKLNVYTLGFVIGPCINASGRLDCAARGIQLLLSEDDEEAKILAMELHRLNTERRDLTAKGVEETIRIIEGSEIRNDKVIVVYKPDIHESIAGIIAGRLKDRYYTPAIVLTDSEHGVKGSGRSIEEYNMFEELTRCKDLLTRFGGHPMAAGLSLEAVNVDKLRLRINELAALTEDDLIQKIYIDAHIGLDDISLALAEELDLLEPYGKGNQKPLFGTRDVKIAKASIIGSNKNVIKLRFTSKTQRSFDGIWFGGVEGFEEVIASKYGKEALTGIYSGQSGNIKLDLVYNLDINEYNGNRSAQLVLKYFR
ncbi:MAG: single-stranded-DNA-specific exonuclease RecJ [Clostridiales bacterium]|nr:single-stranded-DNA-specific exonuclease RecJ [Clostridiales bacterium]